MAKRLSRALGVPVRIAGLRFSLFTGTFSVQGVRVGGGKRPLLRVRRLEARPAMAQGKMRRLIRLDVRGFALNVSESRLGAPLPKAKGVSGVAVDTLDARNGRVVVRSKGGGAGATFAGVSVLGRRLRVGFGRRGLSLRGDLSLRVRRLQLGKVAVSDLRLSLQGGRRGLKIVALTAKLGDGELSSRGSWRLRRGRLGRLRLAGRYRSASIKGRFSLSGSPRGGLRLEGKLRTVGGKAPISLPSKGGVAGAPRLKLDVRLGSRRLRGSLRSWRFR